MKSMFWIATASLLGWCESLGDGCKPLLWDPSDASSGEASTTDAATGGGTTQVLPTGAGPTTDATGDALTQGVSDDTSGDPDTLGTSTAASVTDASTAPVDTEATETTESSPACGDGEIGPGEECDRKRRELAPGVLECDLSCKAVRPVDIATGAAHACVLLSNGHVRCWGSNTHGQLGAADLGDVKKDGVELEAVVTPGAIDLEIDVHDDPGNGRIFAGGATTCVTAANAAKTWCWGLGFGGMKPQELDGHYSAMGIRHEIGAGDDWWLCGLEWADGPHTLRCWGGLDTENKTLFESLSDAKTCKNAVEEDDAGTRSLSLGGDTPRFDVGRELGCTAAGGDLICAGNDDVICGIPNYNPCIANSAHKCPAGCKDAVCTKKALRAPLWEYNVCYIKSDDPSLMECYLEGGISLQDLGECAEGFDAAEVSLSRDFWCAVDPKQPVGEQLCCRGFDELPEGLVKFAGVPPAIVKLAPQSNAILMLGDDGRVLSVSEGAGVWETQEIL